MRPALFILALLFIHSCAAQPAPAQLEIAIKNNANATT